MRRGVRPRVSFGVGTPEPGEERRPPPMPPIAAMSRPVVPVRSSVRSSAWSSDHVPGPIAPIVTPTIPSVITYSQPSPGRKMKKPLPRWLIAQATNITPTTPAAANGVSSPRINASPPPISVMLASQACSFGGFIPMDPNQLAVPSMFGRTWLMPWASITAPTPHRSRSRAKSMASASVMPSACQVTRGQR